MTEYRAPLRDMRFVLTELAEIDGLAALPGFEDATPDLVAAVLEEAARFVEGEVAPLNKVGDEAGAVLENGSVRTPPGFKETYRKYIAAGWNAVAFDAAIGGQGLPQTVAAAVDEMVQSANMAFALCPMLGQGAVDAIAAHGDGGQKARFLDKLVSGEWSGTMCLTEPQAGTDVGALRTRAVREGDHYRITGTKIFITYGEHDWCDNIIHMVLARTPDAPPGSKGVSMFIVPKVLVDGDGSLGQPNDVRAVSLEHKLGIHASPTAVMAFGDEGGAVGYLLGEECGGMANMFTMMNRARLAVGMQGVAIAERAYQRAHAYAVERVQGRTLGDGGGAIIGHPDVRRMLMTMRSQTEAIRALAYFTAMTVDKSRRHPDGAARQANARLTGLLTPVVKAYCSDLGFDIASIGLQVHGGVGFIEETGAAQHLRDARIAMIYEGTNGVQAADLVGRKLMVEGGATVRAFIDGIGALDGDLAAAAGDEMAVIRSALGDGVAAMAAATQWLQDAQRSNPAAAAAGATPYLRLFGHVAGGWLMARAALAAKARLEAGDNDPFYRAKLVTARFFAEQVMTACRGLAAQTMAGSETIMALSAEELARA